MDQQPNNQFRAEQPQASATPLTEAEILQQKEEEKQKKKTHRKKVTVCIVVAFVLVAIACAVLFLMDQFGGYSVIGGNYSHGAGFRDSISYGNTSAPLNSAVKLSSAETWTVCIDPGHGYNDTGAPGSFEQLEGKNEADINLEIALKLRDTLKAHGFGVIMTREEGSEYTKEIENSTPKERAAFANSHEIDLYISIHCDAVETSPESVYGTRIFFYPSSVHDDARAMLAILTAQQLEPIASKAPTIRSDMEYTVIKDTQAPSILIEAGFITNVTDVNKLIDAAWQTKFAEAVTTAVENYVNDCEIPT